MPEAQRKLKEPERRLQELLSDPGYVQSMQALTWEVARRWSLDHEDARRIVLSAIGEPTALATIHEAVTKGERALAALISRRRVIDLLRRDAVRPNHCTLSLSSEEFDANELLSAQLSIPPARPRLSLSTSTYSRKPS